MKNLNKIKPCIKRIPAIEDRIGDPQEYPKSMEKSSGEENEPDILKFAGIMEEEAKVWENAVIESRKI